MANWTNEVNPFGANHAPLLTGLASDGSGPVPLAVDKTTGSLLTAGGSTATSVAINDGSVGTRKATVANLTNANPLAVEVVDASGNQITSFGGGTQYTNGAAQATPTGTVALGYDGANVRALSTDTSGNQNVNVIDQDLVDAGNSSTTPLAGNAAFTGTGHLTLNYSFIKLYVFADQSSAVNGVAIQFSSDNSNWNDASLYTFTAGGSVPNNGQVYGTATRGQYYRIVYTNGATLQTAFRLQSVLKMMPQNGDEVTMTTVPNSTNHAQLTKSSIVGLTTAGGGGYVDVKVNPSGALTVASSTFDGGGTAITSNSTTTTATVGLDINIRSILNTAPTTPGFLDIKGADGNVFVRQATAANLNATVVQGTATNLKAQAENYQGGVAVSATNPLQVSLANTGANATAVKVDGSAVTQPVSGTVTANAGSGTFNIQSNASVNLAQLAGNTISSGVGASGTGTVRVVQANDSGKTINNATGTVSASGDNTIVAAGTNKLKVFAFSLSTTSATAVTCTFKSGAAGTALWTVILQAPTSVSTGANLAVSLPGWLFATASATLLNLNLSAAVSVVWSVSYIDEA